jgi:hypothetical protein
VEFEARASWDWPRSVALDWVLSGEIRAKQVPCVGNRMSPEMLAFERQALGACERGNPGWIVGIEGSAATY